MISKNLDKYRIIHISLKPFLKEIDFNKYLFNKRKECESVSFSIPNELFDFIESQKNRSRYILSLFKKYKILFKNIDFEIFFTFSELVRFFLYLEYFEFMNDVKIEINSIDLIKMKFDKVKNDDKNGFVMEIENGKEFFREYENGKIKNQNEVIKRLS